MRRELRENHRPDETEGEGSPGDEEGPEDDDGVAELWEREALQLRQRVIELERASAQAEQGRDRVTRELEQRQRQQELLSDRVTKLTLEVERSGAAAMEKDAALRDLEKQASGRQRDLDKLQTRYRSLEHELADARRELESARTALSEARASMAAQEQKPGLRKFLRGRDRK